MEIKSREAAAAAISSSNFEEEAEFDFNGFLKRFKGTQKKIEKVKNRLKK